MRPWKRWTTDVLFRLREEAGSASLEFITAGLILLVPLVYLILALSSIQGGALAVEGAARQAARVYVQAPTEAEAEERATRAIEFSLADYGISAESVQLAIECVDETGASCLSRGSIVTVTVRVVVPLPFMPEVLDLATASSVPVQASATQKVSRFWREG